MVPESWLFRAVAAIAVLLSVQIGAFAAPFVFSLDNRPQAPIDPTVDPFVPGGGNGAEDPFGQVLVPQHVGPSPSLNTFSPALGRKLSDADLLTPGEDEPVVNTRRPPNTSYIDAISTNFMLANGQPVRVAFSVDRASQGALGSAVNEQFALNQQSGDIFISDHEFVRPNQFAFAIGTSGYFGPLGPGVFGSNQLLVNQSTLKLKVPVGGVQVLAESNVQADSIGLGTHDHIDAFDFALTDTTGDLNTDKTIYFSVNPDQPGLLPPAGYNSAADIYRMRPFPQPPNPVLFANANQMGLDFDRSIPGHPITPNIDDIDALVVYDRGVEGTLQPGIDYALFSLSPGSHALNHFGLTAADVFFTDFRGAFATYATDQALGLLGTIGPVASPEPGGSVGASSGVDPTSNLSGMSFVVGGDMNDIVGLDAGDVAEFVKGLTRPVEYEEIYDRLPLAGDLNFDGILDFDDIDEFRERLDPYVPGAGGAGSYPGQGVPEPGVSALTAIGLVVLASNQRCRRPRRRVKVVSEPCCHLAAASRPWRPEGGPATEGSTWPRRDSSLRCPSAVSSGPNGASLRMTVKRPAYTIIELLAVITIIGVLLALLLPAIQSAREAARSAQCSDHLRQLALATHSYHSTHNVFPTGSTLAPRANQAGDPWLVFCLAHLEEQELADQILIQRRMVAPPIPIFFCPSEQILVGGPYDRHMSNYCGSGGAGRDLKYVIDFEEVDKSCGDVYTDGVFFPLSKISAKDITDGLTHTLAIGERIYMLDVWANGAYWIGSADEKLCLECSKNVRWPINASPELAGYSEGDRSVPKELRKLKKNHLYFGSRHPGGAWFAFAGGNVHFIADDIAFSVYQDMATRNGGEQLLSADGR